MNYKIRSHPNGADAQGEPHLTFSLTVPAHIGRALDPNARFVCELHDDGILYCPVAPRATRELPAWAGGNRPDAGTAAPRADAEPVDRYDRDELLDCLRAAARVAGGRPTQHSWHRIRRGRTLADGRPWPASNVIATRFGNWNPALEAAGLPTNHGRRASWTERRCIEALQTSPPNSDAFRAPATTRGPAAPTCPRTPPSRRSSEPHGTPSRRERSRQAPTQPDTP
jgi:hypothetical protein